MAKRVYSVFYRIPGEKKWNRLSGSAYHKDCAVKVFQNILLIGTLELGCEMALKPVLGWDSETNYKPILDTFFTR